MKIPDQRETFVCRQCDEKCFHSPVASGRIDGEGFKTYKLLKCERCGNMSLATFIYSIPGSEIGDPEITEVAHFPPLIFREKPDWYKELNEEYISILDEVYDAIDYGLFTLASSGVRTAIDRLLVQQLGDAGSFQKKLKTLLEKDIVTSEEYELLDAIIDAGSASIHRGFSPGDESIQHMMEITEHIFYELCIRKGKSERLAMLAKKLKEETPKRS